MRKLLGNMGTRVRAARGRGVGGGPAAVVVAVGLTAALLLPVSPAKAAVTYGTTLEQSFKAAANGTCVLVTQPLTTRSASLPAGGGAASLPGNDFAEIRTTGGARVASAASSMTTQASVAAAAGGGLASFSVVESVTDAYSLFQNATTGDCGSNGLLGSASATQISRSVLPIPTSGWLTLHYSAGGSGPVSVTAAVGLVAPGSSEVSAYPFVQQALGATSQQVYLPAGWSVAVQLQATADASLHHPVDARAAANVTASLSGTFMPAGAAVNAAHGKRLARRSVVLPAAVSCSGSAAARTTRFARKKAKSVMFLVNNHPVRKVKRIKRARTLGIRVPTSGPITITAKVTPKHGKKARVTRSYVACH